MKGAKLDIVFPKEVYDFLKQFSLKMQTTPAPHPQTGQEFTDPATGKTICMSKTGTVAELIHVAIFSAVFPMIMQNPQFMAEQVKMPKIIKIYQDYLESFGSDKITPQKKG